VSIKNQVATLITYTHTHNNPIIKTIHHAINVTFIEVELFTITCGINQATQIANINYIVVITDSIHTAQRIFDLLAHFYQIQLSIISTELRKFFEKYSIEF